MVFNRLLLKLRLQACSIPNYAVLLLQNLFTLNELLDPRYNVTGRQCRGARGPQPIPLDVDRISFIRENVVSYVQGDEEHKDHMWTMCRYAMSRKFSNLRLIHKF